MAQIHRSGPEPLSREEFKREGSSQASSKVALGGVTLLSIVGLLSLMNRDNSDIAPEAALANNLLDDDKVRSISSPHSPQQDPYQELVVRRIAELSTPEGGQENTNTTAETNVELQLSPKQRFRKLIRSSWDALDRYDAYTATKLCEEAHQLLEADLKGSERLSASDQVRSLYINLGMIDKSVEVMKSQMEQVFQKGPNKKGNEQRRAHRANQFIDRALVYVDALRASGDYEAAKEFLARSNDFVCRTTNKKEELIPLFGERLTELGLLADQSHQLRPDPVSLFRSYSAGNSVFNEYQGLNLRFVYLGIEAVNHLAKNDRASARNLLHELKSYVGNFGTEQFGKRLLEVERRL